LKSHKAHLLEATYGDGYLQSSGYNKKTKLLVNVITGRNTLILSGYEPESFLEVDGSVDFAYLSYLFQK
jgi:hypothetical protein